MSEPASLHYVPESNTLLLSAGADFLLDLAGLLAGLELEGAQVCDLTSLPSLDVRGDFRLIFDPGIRMDGLRTVSDNPLTWRLSFGEEGWLEAAEKIAIVARGERPSHCHLDTMGTNDVEFIVSNGELV